MERVMTKLTGTRSKHRRMREKSCQTATLAESHLLEDSEDVLSLNPGEIQELVNKSMKKIMDHRGKKRKNKKSVFIQKTNISELNQ